MKLVIRTSDSAVIYAQSDVNLTDDGVFGDGWHDPQFNKSNATLTDFSGQLPTGYAGGCFTYNGTIWAVLPAAAGQVAAAAAASLAILKTKLSAEIDLAVMAVYEKPVALGDEYKLREAAAQAYKDSGYTGTVPALVAGFANAAGLAARAATDLILSQAAQLRGALVLLADLRMQKYLVSRAATEAAALAAHTSTMAAIAAIAAALG